MLVEDNSILARILDEVADKQESIRTQKLEKEVHFALRIIDSIGVLRASYICTVQQQKLQWLKQKEKERTEKKKVLESILLTVCLAFRSIISRCDSLFSRRVFSLSHSLSLSLSISSLSALRPLPLSILAGPRPPLVLSSLLRLRTSGVGG